MSNREVMQQALEALDSENPDIQLRAALALRTALEQEPLEYWNAVEGWVKIDEVREHFDSVGCGTIYKTAGEDRVPLYTTPPAAQPEQEPVAFYHPRKGFDWAKPTSIFAPTSVDVEPLPLYASPPAAQPEPPPEWEAINNILNEYGLQAIDFVADWKATLGQAEPVAWGVFEGNLHDIFFTQEEAQEMADLKGTHAEVRPLYTTPPAAQPAPVQEPVAFYHPRNGFYWAKPTSIFAPTVVDVEPMPLYVKWRAAQRPWQGLTEEEVQFYIKKHSKLVNAGYDKATDTNLIAEEFDSIGFYKEVSAVLKERNG